MVTTFVLIEHEKDGKRHVLFLQCMEWGWNETERTLRVFRGGVPETIDGVVSFVATSAPFHVNSEELKKPLVSQTGGNHGSK